MFKNPTPYQIAIYLSGIFSGVFLLILLLLSIIGYLKIHVLWLVVISILCYLFIYWVISQAIEQYIYRKIKVIYKSIHTLKLEPDKKHTRIDLKSNFIDDVQKEVNKWAKDQMKEIEFLKKQEAYRRNFLGNISHELKTPIFNIQGYLETLIDSELKDKAINMPYLIRAAKNVERLSIIVHDLEVISKLESGEIELDMEIFDIKVLAQEVMEDMEIIAAQKDILLFFKEGASQSYKVLADRENIRQVLVNLISNSIKYGVQGGNTQIGFYDMDKRILVEVADNGVGIPVENIGRVFERFYRVDKSRSRKQGGTGLGLSIVKHIIEAHQQTVNVRSRVNIGSTFGFTLERANGVISNTIKS